MPVTSVAGAEAGTALGLGDIIGGLFGLGAADVGVGAGVGAAELGVGADIAAGAGAADLGAAAAGGGLAAEIAAGTAPEVLASAGPAIAAGDVGAQIAAEGGLAATDLGLTGAEAIGPALSEAIDTSAPAVADIASETLGGQAAIGGLNTIDTAAVPAQGLAVGTSAPGTTAGIPTLTGGGANIGAAVSSPTAALQDVGGASENLNALLGVEPQSTQALGGAQLADLGTMNDASSIVPAVNTGTVDNFPVGGAAASPTGTTSETVASAAAMGQDAAENVGLPTISGTDYATQSALANASAGGGTMSNLTSGLSNVLNSPWTRAAELGLPLGFLGYNLLRGPPGLPSAAQEALANAQTNLPQLGAQATQNVGQFNAAAAQDLAAAQANQLTPGMAAMVNQYRTSAINQLYQQVANQQPGVDVTQSSAYVQGLQQINQQANAMQAQLVQQLFQNALSAQSSVNSQISTDANVNSQLDATLMQAAQIQVQQDTAFQQSISSAVSAFGQMAALSTLFGARGLTASPAGGGTGQTVGATV